MVSGAIAGAFDIKDIGDTTHFQQVGRDVHRDGDHGLL